MGVQIFAVFNKEFPELDSVLMEGKTLAHASDAPLLAPLGKYTSVSKETYLELMEEAPEHIDPNFEEEWFNPAEALPEVEKIIQTLQKQPEALPTPPIYEDRPREQWIGYLIEDLETLRSQFQFAAANGAKFHMDSCY